MTDARLRGFGPLGILAFLVIFAGNLLVVPLLGADPINQAYHYLVGNSAAIPGMLYSILIGAAFGEETLFRGFLFERLGKLFGPGGSKKVLIVLLSQPCSGLRTYLSKASRACSRGS